MVWFKKLKIYYLLLLRKLTATDVGLEVVMQSIPSEDDMMEEDGNYIP